VERNALRAEPARRANAWRWGSLWRRTHGDAEGRALLTKPPGGLPTDWLTLVSRPQSQKQLPAIRRFVQQGAPYG